MAGRTFTRQSNGAGNRIKAEHVNELQVALEEDDARIDDKPDLSEVQGVVQTELSNNPTVVAAAEDAAAAAVDAEPRVAANTAAIARVDPGVPGGANQFLVYDSDVGAMGWFDQPVIVSNWAPYKIERDGSASVALKVQTFLAALSSAKIPGVLLPGTYDIDATITGASDVDLFAYGAVFSITDAGTTTPAMQFQDTDNIRIRGLEINGNKSTFGFVTEHKHAVKLLGAENVRLDDVYFHDCKGDGIYLGKSTVTGDPCKNVSGYNVRAIANHRNNLSIVECDGSAWYDSSFIGASGVAPQAGLDIEPNDALGVCRNHTFYGCHFDDNNASNVSLMLVNADRLATHRDVHFYGCTMDRSVTGHGLVGREFYDVTLHGCSADNNTQSGVSLQGPSGTGTAYGFSMIGGHLRRNGRYGFISEIAASNQIKLRDVLVVDNSQAGTYDGIRFATTADDVLVDGVTSTGATQRYGLITSSAVIGFRMDNCDLRGNGTAAASMGADTATRLIGHNNAGYKTYAKGTASVANGDTITHGLTTTPTVAHLTPSVAGRRVAVTARTSAAITVSLTDAAGAAVTTPELVYWQAEV